MQKRHNNPDEYFQESVLSSEKYYLPYVKEQTDLPLDSSTNVLEVGCGFGGNLFPFAKLGCKVSGVDIDSRSIEIAKASFSSRGVNAQFTYSDIHEYAYEGKHDLIMLHDSIEHIHNKKELVLRLQELLTDKGVLFIAFPAWYMPFGGHQQVARTKFVSQCPFIHLLPRKLFIWLLRRLGEPEGVIRDFLDIRDTRMTIRDFERLCNDTKLEIKNRRLYFINPHYEVKFGLKPRVLWKGIACIPHVRDFFATSCHYILQKK